MVPPAHIGFLGQGWSPDPGGIETHTRALARGLVDKVVWFLAPLILGDEEAVPAVAGLAPASPAEGLRLALHRTELLGEDLMMVAYPRVGAKEA